MPITIYSGMSPGRFYKISSPELPNTYVLSCADLDFDIKLDVDQIKRYRPHNRLIPNVLAHEIKQPDSSTVAFLFTPGVGETHLGNGYLNVVRKSAYNELIERSADPTKRPEAKKSLLRLTLRTQYYLAYTVTNVATLIVPTTYDAALDRAVSNNP